MINLVILRSALNIAPPLTNFPLFTKRASLPVLRTSPSVNKGSPRQSRAAPENAWHVYPWSQFPLSSEYVLNCWGQLVSPTPARPLSRCL